MSDLGDKEREMKVSEPLSKKIQNLEVWLLSMMTQNVSYLGVSKKPAYKTVSFSIKLNAPFYRRKKVSRLRLFEIGPSLL